MELVTLIGNIGKGLRYETVHGRQYAIAPITALRPQVLDGSKGPLYYPKDEIAKNHEGWNGLPLVVYHPQLNGQNVSARIPEMMKTEIGRIYNTTITSDGDMKCEGWFDVELVKKVDNRIWNDLTNGNKIEVSTGLFTENEDAPQNSQYNGKAYTHVARNYRPDHLAILPDQVGACSIQEGCGVFNEEKKYAYVGLDINGDVKEKILSLGKLIDDKDLGEDGREDNPHVTIKYGLHSDDPETVRATLESINQVNYNIGAPSLFSGSESGKDYDVIKLDVESDDIRALNTKLSGLPHTDTHKQFNPHVTIGYVKKGLGEKYLKLMTPLNIKGQTDELTFSDSKRNTTSFKLAQPTGNTMDRTKAIEWLTTNCDCWKGKTDALKNMSDPDFHKVMLTNAEKEGEKAVDNEDSKFFEWMNNASDDIRKTFVAAMKKKIMGQLNAAPAVPPKKTPPTPNPDAGATTPPDEDEEAKKKAAAMAAMNDGTANNQLSEEAFLKTLPPSIRATVLNARRIETKDKLRLCGVLTANVTNTDRKKELFNKYMTKDLPELEELIEMMPSQVNIQPSNNSAQPNNAQPNNWFDRVNHNQSAQVTNTQDDISDDVLEIPTTNWKEEEARFSNSRRK